MDFFKTEQYCYTANKIPIASLASCNVQTTTSHIRVAALLEQHQAIHATLGHIHVSDECPSFSSRTSICLLFHALMCWRHLAAFFLLELFTLLPTFPAFHMLYHIRHCFFHFNRVHQYKTTVLHQLTAIWLPRHTTVQEKEDECWNLSL